MKNEPKYKFGSKLRGVRERKGITLKNVAAKAGVSESLVSQIERNKVSPSIDTLMSIASILEIDPEYLFLDHKKSNRVTVIRKDKRNKLKLRDITYEQLSVQSKRGEEYSFEVLLLSIESGGEKGDVEYGHRGTELGVILSGTGELVSGSEKYELTPGDSISFPSRIPHVLRNTGRETLKAIWIVSPPGLFLGNPGN